MHPFLLPCPSKPGLRTIGDWALTLSRGLSSRQVLGQSCKAAGRAASLAGCLAVAERVLVSMPASAVLPPTAKNGHYKSPPRRCCIEAKTKIYGKQMQYRSSQMLFWAVRRCCSKMAQMQYSGVLKHRCKNMLYCGCAPTYSSPYARARRCFVDAAQMQTVAMCFVVVAHPFLLLFSIYVHLHSIYARLPPQMLFCTGGTRA